MKILNVIPYIFLLALTLATVINIPTELFILPWLTNLGQVPYKDFFDHHGFVLYYFLAPLVQDKSLIHLKLLFILLQIINLYLISRILKKYGETIAFFGSILFVSLNFLVTQNHLWFDSFIQTIFLYIYFSVDAGYKTTIRMVLIGFLIGILVFIKIPSATIIVPLLFIYKRKSVWILVSFLTVTLFGSVFLFLSGSWLEFINQYILFNKFLSQTLNKFVFMGLLDYQLKVIYLFLAITTASAILFIRNFNSQDKKVLVIISFLLISCLTFLSGVNLSHFYVLTAFIVILLCHEIYISPKSFKILMLIILFVITVGATIFSFRKSQNINFTAYEYVNDPVALKMIQVIEDKKLEGKKVFVYGDNVPVYFLLNLKLSTKYPLKYPMFDEPRIESFIKTFERDIINDLDENNVEIVLVPDPPAKHWQNLSVLEEFIRQKYPHRLELDGITLLSKDKIPNAR